MVPPLRQGHLRNSSHGQPWWVALLRSPGRRHFPREPVQRWLQHSWCLVRKDSRPLQPKATSSVGVKPLLSVTPVTGLRDTASHGRQPRLSSAVWSAGTSHVPELVGASCPPQAGSAAASATSSPSRDSPLAPRCSTHSVPKPEMFASGSQCDCPVCTLVLRENGALRQSPASSEHPSTVPLAQAGPEEEALPSPKDVMQVALLHHPAELWCTKWLISLLHSGSLRAAVTEQGPTCSSKGLVRPDGPTVPGTAGLQGRRAARAVVPLPGGCGATQSWHMQQSLAVSHLSPSGQTCSIRSTRASLQQGHAAA